MIRLPRLLLASAFSSLLAFSATAADAPAAPLTRTDVEGIVKEYIEKNPEVIMNSMKAMQEKMQAEQAVKSKSVLKDRGAEIFADTSAPVAGNVKGDVTVVEFFDYHCGYCKRMYPTVTQLLKEDKNVRFVFKELPILSEDSETAARAALAVFMLKPEKYFDYHGVLMNMQGQYSEPKLIDEAKKLGVNADKMKETMNGDAVKQELAKNRDLADALGVRGTPAVVIGEQLIPGAIPVEQLKKIIEAERQNKKPQG